MGVSKWLPSTKDKITFEITLRPSTPLYAALPGTLHFQCSAYSSAQWGFLAEAVILVQKEPRRSYNIGPQIFLNHHLDSANTLEKRLYSSSIVLSQQSGLCKRTPQPPPTQPPTMSWSVPGFMGISYTGRPLAASLPSILLQSAVLYLVFVFNVINPKLPIFAVDVFFA